MTSHNKIEVSSFGKAPSGEEAKLFTLSNNKIVVKITNFGGIINQLHVPDSNGQMADVVLGFNTIDDYLEENIYAGAIVGRIAGRLTNGEFTIEGKYYNVTKNEGNNHLHGGCVGFDKKLWNAEIITINGTEALKLSCFSPDGEEGYPGNLNVSVTYSITNENGLLIEYVATTDKATPVCLTNHSYFNLSGEQHGDVLNHLLKINSSYTVEVDKFLLPTGNVLPVDKFNDLRQSVLVKKLLAKIYFEHGDNYLLREKSDRRNFKEVAQLEDTFSGRIMKVFTTAQNIQLYSGMGLNSKSTSKYDINYKKFAGICLECQDFSDATKFADFKPIILYPNKIFNQSTEYRFS